MKAAKVIVILLLLPLIFSQYYEYLNFKELSSHLTNMEEKHPNLIKVETAYERYMIPSPDCKENQCPIYIVTLTNFGSLVDTRPQVFISGALHGDEVLGPNIAIYLLEFLLENYGKDKWVTYLVDNRKLVVMPAPNSEGYFNKRRTELYKGQDLDPNRDFPYDNSPSRCLKTLTGRAMARTITDHMFIIGMTFHGGTSVISYPWGSTNHMVRNEGEEAPDDRAMKEVADMLCRVAGSWPIFYTVGKMTDTVYAIQGGLEDWAYAASWAKTLEEDSFTEQCDSDREINDKGKIFINENNVRFPLYLIETANSKWPDEALWGHKGIINEKGHVPRNIRLSMALIDMAEPYIRDIRINYYDSKLIEFQWKVGGALYVNETYIEFSKDCRITYEEEFVWVNDSKLVGDCENRFLHRSIKLNGTGYWTDSNSYFTTVIPTEFLMNGNYSLRIAAIVDQQWSLQSDPHPKIPPVTHFTRSRIEENYYANSSSNIIKTNKIYYSPVFRPNAWPIAGETLESFNGKDFIVAFATALAIMLVVAVIFKLYLTCQMGRLNSVNQFTPKRIPKYLE